MALLSGDVNPVPQVMSAQPAAQPLNFLDLREEWRWKPERSSRVFPCRKDPANRR